MKSSKSKKYIFLKKYGVFLTIILLIFGVYFYKNTSSFHENDREIPGMIPPEDIRFMEKCSLYNNLLDAQSNKFEVVDYKCSAEKEFQGKIPEGQELTVDIFTKDLNAGIEKFREWLREQGLQESDKLRINYQHKPR